MYCIAILPLDSTDSSARQKPIIRQLKSTRASRPPTGTIEIKLGLVPTNTETPDVNKPYQAMVKRSQNADVTLASAPPVCTPFIYIKRAN